MRLLSNVIVKVLVFGNWSKPICPSSDSVWVWAIEFVLCWRHYIQNKRSIVACIRAYGGAPILHKSRPTALGSAAIIIIYHFPNRTKHIVSQSFVYFGIWTDIRFGIVCIRLFTLWIMWTPSYCVFALLLHIIIINAIIVVIMSFIEYIIMIGTFWCSTPLYPPHCTVQLNSEVIIIHAYCHLCRHRRCVICIIGYASVVHLHI